MENIMTEAIAITHRMPVRNSDLETSHESAMHVGELAAKLRERIIGLAREAGEVASRSMKPNG